MLSAWLDNDYDDDDDFDKNISLIYGERNVKLQSKINF